MELSFTTSFSDIAERSSSSYGPLPPGEYECMIVKSQTKTTKAGTGSYLELEMHIISGDHTGRRHWERLNLDNPSKQTVEIARKQLAQLCLALDMAEQHGDQILINIKDSSALHDKPFVAQLDIDKKDETRNILRGCRAISGAPVSPAKLAAPKAPPPAAASAKSARPWG